jgi:uncharacterized protein YkwD
MKLVASTLMLAFLASANAAAGAPVDSDPYVERLSKLINGYRAEHAGTPLALTASLSVLAHEHAVAMAKDGRLSHDGFQQRFSNAQSPHCVENVAASGTAEATFDAWRDSPTHARNLLDPGISRMGIGVDGRYVAFFACR